MATGGAHPGRTTSSEHEITPGCWTGMFVKHTCVTMWSFFAITILMTGAVAAKGFPVPSMVSGWEDKNALTNQRLAASTLVRDNRYAAASRRQLFSLDAAGAGADHDDDDVELPLGGGGDGFGFFVPTHGGGEAAGARTARRGRALQTGGSDEEILSEREATFDSVSILYDGLGGNMLDAAHVDAAIHFEGALLDAPVWAHACKLEYSALDAALSNCSAGTSILNYIHTNPAAHEAQCQAGFCMMPAASMAACGASISWGEGMCRSKVFNWRRDGVLQPESAWGGLIAAAICGTDPVSTLINKALLPVDHTCAPPESLYLKADYDMGWPLAGFNSTTRFVEQFQVLVNGDAKLVTAALNAAMKDVSATPPNARYYVGEATGGKVVSILWTARSSMGWRQMLMADASLAMGSIAFIFLFVWFHTGSIVLTLVGMYEILMSLPLALFFYCVVGGQQNVSFLAVVSIYLILCIGADDIFVFVDCWKATKYAPPHISGSLESRFVVAYRQAASAMFSTTSTTVICLVCAAFMPIPQLASFAIFAALAVTLDYCLVITWFPAALLAYEKYCGGACCCIKCEQTVCCARTAAGDGGFKGDAPPPRRMVRLMRDKFAPALYKNRYVSFFAMVLLSAGSIGACVALARPGKDLVFMEAFTPTRQREEIMTHKFYVQNDMKIMVATFYGLDRGMPAVHAPTNQLIPPDTGTWGVSSTDVTLNYDDAFDLTPARQAQLVADCDAASADATLVDGGEVFCLLNDLKAWDPASFPYADEAALYAALVAFYASPTYAELAANYTMYAYHTGFLYDGGIKAVWHTFNSTIPPNIKPDPIALSPHFSQWDGYVGGAGGGGGASGVAPPFHTTPLWFMFNMLSTLLINALVTCAIAVVAAFVVLLLVTMNWYLALLATVCILLVMSGVIAIVMLLGQSLGMYECLVMILAIGLAVDYDVHLTHFYNEAKGTRREKAIEALSSVGISIVGGACTTMGAGLPLFFTAMTFFKLCGWFIFFTSLCSIVQSFFLLMPMLMILGPEGTQGDLSWLCRRGGRGGAAAGVDGFSSDIKGVGAVA